MFNVGKKGILDPRSLCSNNNFNIYEHTIVRNFIYAYSVCMWVLVFPKPEFSKHCAKVLQAFCCRVVDSGFLQPLCKLQKEIIYLWKGTTVVNLDLGLQFWCKHPAFLFFSSSCVYRSYTMEFRKGSGKVVWSIWMQTLYLLHSYLLEYSWACFSFLPFCKLVGH